MDGAIPLQWFQVRTSDVLISKISDKIGNACNVTASKEFISFKVLSGLLRSSYSQSSDNGHKRTAPLTAASVGRGYFCAGRRELGDETTKACCNGLGAN